MAFIHRMFPVQNCTCYPKNTFGSGVMPPWVRNFPRRSLLWDRKRWKLRKGNVGEVGGWKNRLLSQKGRWMVWGVHRRIQRSLPGVANSFQSFCGTKLKGKYCIISPITQVKGFVNILIVPIRLYLCILTFSFSVCFLCQDSAIASYMALFLTEQLREERKTKVFWGVCQNHCLL